jgi:hypothetical protein
MNAINCRIGLGSERDSYKTNPYTWVGGIHLSWHLDPLVWISTDGFFVDVSLLWSRPLVVQSKDSTGVR